MGKSISSRAAPGNGSAVASNSLFAYVRPWQLTLLVAICMLTPGCSGCWTSDPNAQAKKAEEEDDLDPEKLLEKKKKKKKDEEKKKDFDYQPTSTLPEDQVSNGVQRNYVRRGHWVGTRQFIVANNFDFSAVFETRITEPSGEPFDVDQTSYTSVVSRPAKLAKGQVRPLESMLLLPRQSIQGRTPQIHVEIAANYGGSPILQNNTPVSFLEEPEYIMLVLANTPASYLYLSQLDSVSPPGDLDSSQLGDADFRSFRVLLPNVSKGVAMPGNALMWTTVSAIVWDNIDPSTLTLDQQQAMIDWLHFGGQIIINGPTSLGQLKGSFLDPFLPADDAQTVNLDAERLAKLNQAWTITPSVVNAKSRALNLVKDRPILGCELVKRARGEFLPNTDNLAAETFVGRGRIVVTGFSLSAGAIINWKSFDNFFNACLLRRPPRDYYRPISFDGGFSESVAIGYPSIVSSHISEEPRGANRIGRFLRDPRMNSTVRFFSRDVGWLPGEEVMQPKRNRTITGSPLIELDEDRDKRAVTTGGEFPTGDPWRFGGYVAATNSGVAGWNDFSGASEAARLSLKQTARIKVPDARFVLNTLSIYLLILVPLNWLIFWGIGRVEWAWVAAPIIALGGAYSVIRMAELDIGFARSRTEIDVVEMHGGYDRAHVTRYAALYTSLSSDYDMAFGDESALVQPMAFSHDYKTEPGMLASEVHFRRDQDLRLSGLNVKSNETSLVHSEQLMSMEGPIELVGDDPASLDLHNGSILDLRDVVVLRCTGDLNYEAAYIEHLSPGQDTSLQFSADQLDVLTNYRSPVNATSEQVEASRIDSKRENGIWPKRWQRSATFGESSENDRSLRLTRLGKLAARQLTLQPGDIRLIGWSSEPLPGVDISPAAAQQAISTFVLVHLKRAAISAPRPDLRCRVDITNKDEEDEKKDDDLPAVPIDESLLEQES